MLDRKTIAVLQQGRRDAEYRAARFRRASLNLLSQMLTAVAVVGLLVSTVAWAADAVTETPTTMLGHVLQVVYSGVLLVLGWAAVRFSGFMQARAKDTAAGSLLNSLWVKAVSAARYGEAKLRPDIQKALADGVLTKEEAADLFGKVMDLLTGTAAAEIASMPKVLGLDGPARSTFVAGVLENAVTSLKKPEALKPAQLPVPPS